MTLVIAACGGAADTGSVAPLAETDAAQIQELLAASERPVVLNVWGSWCVPCRSEAPLFRAAHDRLGNEVRFVGVAVRDRQGPARAFLAEFDLDGFEHYLDPPGVVPADLGGRGVPLTFFFAPGGELVELHSGIIDERTLALQIDELLRR